MFVLASTYRRETERLQSEASQWRVRCELMQARWNALVGKLSDKGPDGLLAEALAPQFSPDEIKKLLMLCHPDKHDGKEMAGEMTRKLLALRAGKGEP